MCSLAHARAGAGGKAAYTFWHRVQSGRGPFLCPRRAPASLCRHNFLRVPVCIKNALCILLQRANFRVTTFIHCRTFRQQSPRLLTDSIREQLSFIFTAPAPKLPSAQYAPKLPFSLRTVLSVGIRDVLLFFPAFFVLYLIIVESRPVVKGAET